jgi:hypothetical protein
VARTAVVAGTASAVSGRVQRRQAERFADRDAQIYAQRQQAYQQQVAPMNPPPPAPPPAAAPVSQADKIEQLKQLGELKAQGVLTDDEFAAEKAKILAT